jgi:predicted nucleotidyltransferase component of viral defense system
MIPQIDILTWHKTAPWQEISMVEQDLIIERAIVQIYSDPFLFEHLAFRGGTALHKLFLKPQARYSEDIDLIQLVSEPIKETIDHLREAMGFLGEPRVKFSKHNVVLHYHFETEFAPVFRMRLKIEMNTREHGSQLPTISIPHSLESRWFSGSANIHTFDIHELLASKLRALYQRRKGRDLFDVSNAFARLNLDADKLIHLFRYYSRENPISQAQFRLNLLEKLESPAFRNDLSGLLRPEIQWDWDAAFQWLLDEIISRI